MSAVGVIIDGVAIMTAHPRKTRAIIGRVDAACGFYLARIGDSDPRSVAELRARRWPGYMNRHYRRRNVRTRSLIMLSIAVRW